MKRMILVCWLCLAATSVYAEDDVWLTDEKTGCNILRKLLKKDTLPDISLVWSGACRDGKADGIGVIKFYTKKERRPVVTIQGTLNNGECVGESSVEEIDGRKYVGETKQCVISNGNGVMKRPDGLSCSGKFKDGYFQKGTIDYPGGSDYRKHLGYSTYTGEAKGTHPHGEGTMTYQDGSIYSGEWRDGAKHGKGAMIYQNGDKYSGGWSAGKEHGKGTYTFKDGNSYEGLWEHGERIKIF